MMKNWNFKVQGSPQEIIEKLESALRSADGFVFSVDNDSKLFNFRKRVKFPDQILHRNRVVAKGKILSTTAGNETDLEISFAQHFFMKMTVFSVIIFWISLIALIPRISSGITLYIIEGVAIAVGVLLLIALQKKFKRDIQKYKTLISEILQS